MSNQQAEATSSFSSERQPLVIATRLHLGKASAPPPIEKLESQVRSFSSLIGPSHKGLIAVDATPKLEGYDLVSTVQSCVDRILLTKTNAPKEKLSQRPPQIEIIPVTPWRSFCPALNALVSYAKVNDYEKIGFVSAEVQASSETIDKLSTYLDGNDDTLMAGAALPGHLYEANTLQALGGRTCPWNTLAIWNVRKLALVGFPLVSDMPPSAGIEEVATVAILQSLIGRDEAKCKLVNLSGISWDEGFQDPERKAWHEQKMASKAQRAESQLSQFPNKLGGTVHHI